MSIHPIPAQAFRPAGAPLADKLNRINRQVDSQRSVSFGPEFVYTQLPNGYALGLNPSAFGRASGPRIVTAKVVAWALVSGEDTRWAYTMREVATTVDEAGVPIMNGLTGDNLFEFTAYNLTEVNNVAQGTGTQGNSIDESASDYAGTSMTIQPVGGGTAGTPGNEVIVDCRERITAGGSTLWTFEYQNAVDGAC